MADDHHHQHEISNEGTSSSSNSNNHRRSRPNVLITGTPGCGKTTIAMEISERLSMRHLNVGDLIKKHKCYDGRDEELDTNILDEDKLLDVMESLLEEAATEDIGCVVDFHVCDIFPERWFDLVLVLRARTEVLFDRLSARGYNERKRSENLESEIMQVILEEAREAYDVNIVHEVQSNTIEDMESNIERVKLWTEQWIKDHHPSLSTAAATGSSSQGDDNDIDS